MKVLKKKSLAYVIIAFAAIFTFSSCDELTENTKQFVSFSGPSMQFTIDSVEFSQKSTLENVVVFDQVIDLDEALNETDYSMADVESISVTEVILTVKDPQNIDLTLFEGTKFFLGESQTLVAEISNVDESGQSVSFNIIDGEILNYMSADNTVRVVISMDENTVLPTETVDVLLETAYKAEVEVL